MKKKNQNSHTNRYILLGLSVFCALMMVLSSFSDIAAGPFRALANVTVIPLQQGINHVGGWLGDLTDNFSTLQQLQDENRKLKEQVDALTTENNYLQEESYEYERLQELYQLDQNYAEYEKTAAHVIGKDAGNWFSTFTIDKGSMDGIAVDMNVLAGSGLVGIVTETGPTWAKVRTIIDDSTNISGMVLSTSDTCIVSGDLSLMSSGQISFDQMENNDNPVAVGDQIVTSYISDKYLQGILIGSISEVNVDSNNLTRSGYIIPAVDFRNIQEVLVITTTKAELTGEDETGEEQQ
ncbi:MAG TPA: rod shape-determining protein MreC [Candidatus Mediterraneibacter merdipullorum]|nr:rod shape-determining protein MreC [Candidatus Mediterraneibacter merdipullorum]